jgi:phosphate transport system substrate-binding protein
MGEYVAEFMSDKASGEEGYLSDRGLIPMPEKERAQFAADAKAMKPLKM